MMIELGHYALVLALVLAVAQATLPLIGAERGIRAWMALAKPAAIGQFCFLLFSFLALVHAFVISDFSVAIVYMHSHSATPLLYKIAAAWGQHEGSLLLWVVILAFFGALVAIFGENLPPRLKARTLAVQAMIGIAFILFTLFTSNPFARLSPAPFEGEELNPLLQDPGLAFHPPMLYVGYVGFSMAFSFAVAALIEGKIDAAWARWVRPWTLLSWTCLTGGIALGARWAYYELGWGGWWFWDPVENASFMPWLMGTALLHSAIVVEKRDALKAWTLLLAILTFGFSLLGTFLVRSGVITSVHAFAQDPARGVFILGILALALGGALTLFALRAPMLKPGGMFAPVSREAALMLNNLFIATLTVTVFFGTLLPLMADVFGLPDVSVGPPYYKWTFVLISLPLLLLAAVGPLLGWKRGDLKGAMQRLWGVGVLALAAMALGFWIDYGNEILAGFGIGVGVWLLAGTFVEWAERIKLFRVGLDESWRRLKHLPRAAYGMTIAHAGLAITVIGITAAAAWKTEEVRQMRPGESIVLGDFTYRLESVNGVRGENYIAEQAHFSVLQDGKVYTNLYPERRQYMVQPMPTTEAAIESHLFGDLYAVIGEGDGKGAWTVRLYEEPLVPWIWTGSIIMVLGGIVSMSDRRYRVGAPSRLPAARPVKA
jgi:cytochrome c-type biogenesis protein CcmF